MGGSLAYSVFGAADFVPADIAAASFTIIITAVIFFELLFEYLHELTHDTEFNEMVSKIKNELMIVGCSAFIFKIIINNQKIPDNWLLSLELADMVVPLTSFMYAIQGIYLIRMCISKMSMWTKAYSLTLSELLHNYYSNESKFIARIQWFSQFVRSNSDLEFRVLYNIFCEQV